MPLYLRPRRLDEALDAMADRRVLALAGGTDIYPARVGRALDEDVLDLGAMAELRGIEAGSEGWRIGSGVTWSEIARAGLPPVFDGLRAAAAVVGGVQIQNTGTIGGNLCTASAAADGIPNLMALDARVELASVRGRRVLAIDEFVLGSRWTALAPDELVVAVHVPRPRADALARFEKLGARRYLVISITMLAVVVETLGGRIASARIAVGACAAKAMRLPRLEARLVGKTLDADLVGCLDDAVLAPLRPIDDIRATAAFRREATNELLRRTLDALGRDSALALS